MRALLLFARVADVARCTCAGPLRSDNTSHSQWQHQAEELQV